MKKQLENLKVVAEELRKQLSENRERQKILVRDIWLEENDMELGQTVFVSDDSSPLDSEWKKGILIDAKPFTSKTLPVVKIFNKSGDPGKREWHYQIQRIKK